MCLRHNQLQLSGTQILKASNLNLWASFACQPTAYKFPSLFCLKTRPEHVTDMKF